jgi:hypothetical protein
VGLDFGSLANATPAGAAASILTAAASTPTSSGNTGAPSATGQKVINIAGFGSKANGSATQSLTAAEPDRGDYFPSTPTLGLGVGLDVPPWVLPALGVVLALAVVGAQLKRRK